MENENGMVNMEFRKVDFEDGRDSESCPVVGFRLAVWDMGMLLLQYYLILRETCRTLHVRVRPADVRP
jgi:hypothetical protein